jgi:hypothetical protein
MTPRPIQPTFLGKSDIDFAIDVDCKAMGVLESKHSVSVVECIQVVFQTQPHRVAGYCTAENRRIITYVTYLNRSTI